MSFSNNGNNRCKRRRRMIWSIKHKSIRCIRCGHKMGILLQRIYRRIKTWLLRFLLRMRIDSINLTSSKTRMNFRKKRSLIRSRRNNFSRIKRGRINKFTFEAEIPKCSSIFKHSLIEICRSYSRAWTITLKMILIGGIFKCHIPPL